jgi:hypothetical protein
VSAARRAGLMGLLALVLPGAIFLGVVLTVSAVFIATQLYQATKTGVAALDVWAIRGNAAWAIVRVFGLRANAAVARAFMSILRNEGAYTPRADGTYPMGDQSIARIDHYGNQVTGPAVGPGQVLWTTLIRLGFAGDPRDLAKVGNEGEALLWAARAFNETVREAGGDMADAIRRYNGSGSAAEKYRDNALAFAATTWGGLA